MRVLISNYSSAHTILKAVLIKLGHKYEIATNGPAVVESITRPAGPRFAIFDSNLPGLNGFDICRQVRAADPDSRAYLIVMTPDNDRTEVIMALDAGADDYLQKPFDSTELIARLRVAERIQDDRAAFAKKLEEAVTAAKLNGHANGHALNGHAADDAEMEKLARDAAAAAAEVNQSIVLGGKDEPLRARKLFSDKHAGLNSLSPFNAFEALIIKTLGEMGLGDASVLSADIATPKADLTIHSVVLLPEKSAWLDLVIDLDRRSAEGLFAAMTGSTDATRDELMDMAGETLNMIQGGIKTALQDGSLEVFTPVIPNKISPDRRDSISLVATECGQVSFSLPNIILTVTIVPHVAEIVTKTIDDVRVRDVVVEPVRVPGSKLNLVEKGTMMNNQHLSRLREIAGYGMNRMKFEMITPSEVSVLLVKI
jgi:DNA-binding response OmpR family regulator